MIQFLILFNLGGNHPTFQNKKKFAAKKNTDDNDVDVLPEEDNLPDALQEDSGTGTDDTSPNDVQEQNSVATNSITHNPQVIITQSFGEIHIFIHYVIVNIV